MAVPPQLFPFCPVHPFPGRRLLSLIHTRIHWRACSIGALAPCPLPVGTGDSPGTREIPTSPEPCDGMPMNEETRGGSEGGKHLRRSKEDPSAPKKQPGKIRQYIPPSAAALEVKVPFLSLPPERGAEPRPILYPLRSSLPIFPSGTLVGTPGHRLQFCF